MPDLAKIVAKNIGTNELEELVRKKTRDVLNDPTVILTEIQDELANVSNGTNINSLDDEITKL